MEAVSFGGIVPLDLHEKQNQGSLFQAPPRAPDLSVHFLWNRFEQLLQVRGWSLTLVATCSMFSWQCWHVLARVETEAMMSLLTWSMACWLVAMWLAAMGSIRYLTSHAGAEIPGEMIEEPWICILSFV